MENKNYSSEWVNGFVEKYPEMDFSLLKQISLYVWKGINFNSVFQLEQIYNSTKCKVECASNEIIKGSFPILTESIVNNDLQTVQTVTNHFYCECKKNKNDIFCCHQVALIKKIIIETGTDEEKDRFLSEYKKTLDLYKPVHVEFGLDPIVYHDLLEKMNAKEIQTPQEFILKIIKDELYGDYDEDYDDED